jgi:nuclear receptor interaction protein
MSSKVSFVSQARKTDTDIVLGHPYEPMIAASGIDNTIKIFSCDRKAQEDARNGVNILDPDNASNVLGPNASRIGGLESRKRIHDSYRIMSQNDVERRGGVNEAHITVSSFQLL